MMEAKAKTCTQCHEEKLLEEFRVRKDGRLGRTSQCRSCLNAYGKEYSRRPEVQERKKKQLREWRRQNGVYYKQHNKNYYKANKKHMLQYIKQRRKQDSQYKMTRILRDRLRRAIQGNYKAGSAVKDLGCSIEFLKGHLESKFYSRSETGERMTWSNHGIKGWHIDHVKPLASFDLIDRSQFLAACHFTNLQPLWAEDNLSKSAKHGSR
jgi:hypothetical protein